MRLFSTVLLATLAVCPAISSAQCNANTGGQDFFLIGAVQAGALNQPDPVRDFFNSSSGPDPLNATAFSLDTDDVVPNNQDPGTRATSAADLATGKLAYFISTIGQNNDIRSVGVASAQWFDRVCFDLPAGMPTANIQIIMNIAGTINCLNQTLSVYSCLNPGTLPTRLQFDNTNVTVPFRDLTLLSDQATISHQIIINATVMEGEIYQVQASTGAAVQFDGGTVDFGNTLDFQFVLPDGVSFESASGVLLAATDPGVCGDSVLDAGEACDDGNSANGDGCDASCQVEAGFECTLPAPGPTASVCTEIIIDSDDDGVSDSNDLCPGTAPGANVDVFGCSAEQLDADNDGVSDADDECPGTAPGADVDAFGCADLQVDADSDGVCDLDAASSGPAGCAGNDVCADTVIPESVPMATLKKNRYALTGNPSNRIFDSQNKTEFTTADTGGCSCEQIIDELGLGGGHVMFGCSKSAMQQWIDRP